MVEVILLWLKIKKLSLFYFSGNVSLFEAIGIIGFEFHPMEMKIEGNDVKKVFL